MTVLLGLARRKPPEGAANSRQRGAAMSVAQPLAQQGFYLGAQGLAPNAYAFAMPGVPVPSGSADEAQQQQWAWQQQQWAQAQWAHAQWAQSVAGLQQQQQQQQQQWFQ